MLGALAAWLFFSGVEIVSDSACPAPAEVGRRLAQIAPSREQAAPAGHRARLSRGDRTVHVELLNDAGARIAERDLDANERCEDLAQAVAIVIAAWETDLDPPVAGHVALPRPAQITTGTAVVSGQPPRGSAPSFDLGLALMASSTGGQVAPGARLEGWIAPANRHLGLGVVLSGATARSESVGALSGAARWTRFAIGAGPDARLGVGRTTMDAHAHLLAAALHVEGVGLATNSSDTSAQFGAGAGVRIGRPWGNATPWIGADVLYWAGHDQLTIAGSSSRGELPHLEAQIAVGLSLGRFP